MTDPGKMRYRIQFQKFNGARDAETGDPAVTVDENWVTQFTAYAFIDPIKGREFYAASQAQSAVTHKILLRYRKGITSDMRIKFGGRIFTLDSPPIDFGERHEELMLMVTEVL